MKNLKVVNYVILVSTLRWVLTNASFVQVAIFAKVAQLQNSLAHQRKKVLYVLLVPTAHLESLNQLLALWVHSIQMKDKSLKVHVRSVQQISLEIELAWLNAFSVRAPLSQILAQQLVDAQV